MGATAYCGKCGRVRSISERVEWIRPHWPGAHQIRAVLACGHIEQFIGPARDWPLAQPLFVGHGKRPA